MHRINTLRNQALNSTICLDEFFYNFYKCYASKRNLPFQERYADAFYFAFSNLTPSISEGELIVGKCDVLLSSSDKSEWENIYMPIAEEESLKAGSGRDSHMAIDYDLILNCGINGIIKKINTYLTNCDDKNKISFYKASIRCLEAIIKCADNYAEAAEKLAATETNDARRKEYEKITQVCRNVPANPAGNFYEAVQSVHFISFCLCLNPLRLHIYQLFQLGRPDRYLLPYYIKDIADGTMTREYAQLLLDCLGIQISNRVPTGLSCGYMVGGRDENGDIVANELTEMCMQVVDDIKLIYPAVGLCYTDGMDDSFLEKACEILSHGCSHPAIFNDDIITKGLKSYGVPESEAHSYIHSTCVEITPVASSNVWVASPYTNMPQILLDILDREYSGFEELLSVLFEKIDTKIKLNLESERATQKVRRENSINPLLSCFVNDCLERGTDIEQGGARYNWIMPSFVGMANLVDSLYALNEIVFEKGVFSVTELKTILDSNFEGNEPLRKRLLTSIPKYGNDIDEVDSLFIRIMGHISAECKKYADSQTNFRLVPSVFCWIMHEFFGKDTGATPDGRKAGFPLGDGSGPCQGRELKGPTASILSSTKWPHHELIGGVAVNMKFSKKSLGAHSLNTMKSLFKTYLQRGGFEMQVNVIDRETLEKALLEPDEYRDLVVRIGGYSDYFVKLSPGMQQEVILRSEHKI